MNLKKVNAVLSIMLSVCVFFHAGIVCYMILSGVYLAKLSPMAGRTTATVMILHAACSIGIMARGKYPGIKYVKSNIKTMLQRLLGTLSVLLLAPHILMLKSLFGPAPAAAGLNMVVQTLFFLLIFGHLAISFSKALITLGLLKTDKGERTVNTAMYAACFLFFAFTVFCVVRFIGAYA